MTLPPNPTLVADIGGTNTRVALAHGPRLVRGTVEKFRNAEHSGLEAILAAYLDARGVRDCGGACVAVAGPVRDGEAELTNHAWKMTTATLGAAAGTGIVVLLNDLQAQSHAIGHIADDDLKPVIAGPVPRPGATAMTVGVGTGFNAAPVYAVSGGRLVPPVEAGHVNLSARGPEMRRLVQYLESTFGFASVEDALSGRGLANVYAWAASEAGSDARPDASAIVAAHQSGSDPIAARAIRVFVQTLGMVAGNLALQNLAYGGLYLIGGVARGVSPWFGEYGFADAFRDKGRFAGFMEEFRVDLVTDDFAALTGCASHLSDVIAAR